MIKYTTDSTSRYLGFLPDSRFPIRLRRATLAAGLLERFSSNARLRSSSLYVLIMYQLSVKLSHRLSAPLSSPLTSRVEQLYGWMLFLYFRFLPTFYPDAFVAAGGILVDITVRVTSIRFSSQINPVLSPDLSHSIRLTRSLIENRALGVSGSFATALSHTISTQLPMRRDLFPLQVRNARSATRKKSTGNSWFISSWIPTRSLTLDAFLHRLSGGICLALENGMRADSTGI